MDEALDIDCTRIRATYRHEHGRWYYYCMIAGVILPTDPVCCRDCYNKIPKKKVNPRAGSGD